MTRSDAVINRLGETTINTMGSKMWIIKYNNRSDIDVEFEDGYIANSMRYDNFCNGNIKNPFYYSVYGKGYFGEGNYKSTINGKSTKQYETWSHMLTRCYDKKYHEKQSTYIGCSVYSEWHNFQIFAEWYDANYYEIEGERMELDKDWIVKGNKVYSPETCVFVPKVINLLIIKRKSNRGDLPIGVCVNKKKYGAQCRNNIGKNHRLGSYETPEQAFKVYKTFKESHIKQVAELYKNYIPAKLYEAMIRYEININD